MGLDGGMVYLHIIIYLLSLRGEVMMETYSSVSPRRHHPTGPDCLAPTPGILGRRNTSAEKSFWGGKG
jgi:hypothetical protein